MASKGARQKTPRIDNERNLFAKLLFSFLFLLSVILIIMKGFVPNIWYMILIRYLLLMSSIIPMSIQMNVDLARFYSASKIDNDNDPDYKYSIEGTITRSISLVEELARV